MAFGSDWDNTVIPWNVKEQKQVARLKGHTDAVHSVSYSFDIAPTVLCEFSFNAAADIHGKPIEG